MTGKRRKREAQSLDLSMVYTHTHTHTVLLIDSVTAVAKKLRPVFESPLNTEHHFIFCDSKTLLQLPPDYQCAQGTDRSWERSRVPSAFFTPPSPSTTEPLSPDSPQAPWAPERTICPLRSHGKAKGHPAQSAEPDEAGPSLTRDPLRKKRGPHNGILHTHTHIHSKPAKICLALTKYATVSPLLLSVKNVTKQETVVCLTRINDVGEKLHHVVCSFHRSIRLVLI